MLVCSIFTGFIGFLLNSYYTGKKLGYTSWMQLKDVSKSYEIALLIATAVYFLKFLPISYWVVLPAQIILGFTICIFACEKIQLAEYVEIKKIVVSIIKKRW